MPPNVVAAIRLMLVTDDALVAGRDLIVLCRAAAQGGASAVELRLKRASGAKLVEAARSLIAALKIPVLINDRLDVALAAGAAGVHLGPDDLPVPIARRIVPPGFLIGASVGLPQEIENGLGADYWGIGPWRASTTKSDAGAALGANGFQRILRLGEGKPGIAIGGVRPEDVPAVVAAGGAGVAVVSGILAAEDVEAETRRYAEQFRL